MEIDVVVSGEDERLPCGPAVCEQLLEAPVVDRAFDCGEVVGDEVGVHADAPSMPSAPSTSSAEVIAVAHPCRRRSLVPSERAEVISPGTA